MKTLTYIIASLISAQITFGQQESDGLIGRLLVNADFEFIELINDSLVYSSLTSSNDTLEYEILENEFIIKDRLYYPSASEKNRTKEYKYLINNQTDSSLNILLDYYNESDFYDIRSLSKNIFDFQYIELEYLTSWDNDRFIRIDNLGNYYEKITFSPLKSRLFKRKSKTIKKRLSNKELQSLMLKLSDFYAIHIPHKRVCAIDGELSNFVIKTNGQLIESKGCDLSWIHSKLLEYLLTIK